MGRYDYECWPCGLIQKKLYGSGESNSQFFGEKFLIFLVCGEGIDGEKRGLYNILAEYKPEMSVLRREAFSHAHAGSSRCFAINFRLAHANVLAFSFAAHTVTTATGWVNVLGRICERLPWAYRLTEFELLRRKKSERERKGLVRR